MQTAKIEGITDTNHQTTEQQNKQEQQQQQLLSMSVHITIVWPYDLQSACFYRKPVVKRE